MKKGLGAPIAITILVVLFCATFAFLAIYFILSGGADLWEWIVCLAVMLATIGISIFVLAERVKEIKSGEEDDLGKY